MARIRGKGDRGRPRSRTLATFCFALVLIAAGCTGHQIRSDLTAAEKRADLASLRDAFDEREGSLTPESRRAFEARVAALDAEAEGLSHAAFVMGVQHAVAAADNGHTETLLGEALTLRLPLGLQWFAEGLHIVATDPAHVELLGARILAFDGTPSEAALTRLGESFGGTVEHVRVLSEGLFIMPELLQAIGVTERAGEATLRVTLADGRDVERRVVGVPKADLGEAGSFIGLLERLEPVPLYLRDPQESAFVAWLGESDAVYIRINRNDDRSLPESLAIALASVEARGPRHAIVDLRQNGGGNYSLTVDFAERLPALIPADGRLVLITGNRTFSAAIATAAILKARGGPRILVIGERVGDRLRFWSEGGFVTLPKSRLRVHTSDGYHDWQDGTDSNDPRYRRNPRQAQMNASHSAAAGSLEPDVFVALDFTSFIAGRDPVLDTVQLILSKS